MRRRLPAVLLACTAAAVEAQTVEITPVVGFRFGGGACAVEAPCGNEKGARFEVDDAGSLGLSVGYPVGDGAIELLYARQGTRLQTSQLFAGVPLFELALESWQLGGSYLFRDDDARVRPFVGFGLGLTRLLPEPPDLDDETRFSVSLGAGARLELGRHVALRAEARAFFTVVDGDSGSFCGRGYCEVYAGSSQIIAQVDLRAGLTLGF